MSSNICLMELRRTREVLKKQIEEIEKKINAIDVVLKMFDKGEQVKSVPDEEKKRKQRDAYEKWRDKKNTKKLSEKAKIVQRGTLDEPIGTIKDSCIKGEKLA